MNQLTPNPRLQALKKMLAAGLVGGVLGIAQLAVAQNLTLETWRIDDEPAWQKQILPAFTQAYPRIQVNTQPSHPVEYDDELWSRLKQGTAGDLITCRPFDKSIALYVQGHLKDITHMTELRQFRSHSKIAWTTYYAERVFCMPVGAVMTGFFYNTKIFKALNLSVPTTEEELFEVLQAIQQTGTYTPLAFGTKDAWQAAQVLLAGIGPNYWAGERGRKNLLTGRAKFTDPDYVDAWRMVARLADYLPNNHDNVGEEDARELFLSGRAAIYPAGSWEIGFLTKHPNANNFGVFAPPQRQDKHNCYVVNHLDKGIGINANSPNQKVAETFISWLSTEAFASTMANALHGFLPLTNHPVQINNPLAQEMLSWRQQCDTTIRINSQFLNQAWPQLEQELWDNTVRVMRKQITPEEAAKHIASGVEKWFRPL
jgi:raffinose/stachyose/melibiose transport system substrate-binding protein